MKKLFVLMLLSCSAVFGAEPLRLAATPEAFLKWSGAKSAEFLAAGGPKNVPAIRLGSSDAAKSALCELPLDLKTYAGKLIVFSADIRLDDVKQPAKPYYGLKLMIVYTRADGTRHWAEDLKPKDRYGSRDWDNYEAIAKVPADAREVSLSFGIQQAAGRAEFANLTMEEVE